MNKYRLSNGRYASQIDSLKDRIKHTFEHLSQEADKWYRAWLATAKENSRLLRENAQLREDNKKFQQILKILQQ